MTNQTLWVLLQTSLVVGLMLPPTSQVTVTARASEAEDIDQAVVKIGSSSGVGTGVVVCIEGNTASILTATHVVAEDGTVDVSIYPRAELTYQAQVLRRDPLRNYNGLALVVLKDAVVSRLRTLEFATVDPRKGDSVFAVGFPGSTGPWNHMPGRVVAMNGLSVDLSTHVEEGNSGGPVINERSGKAVGLVMREEQGLGHALPASIIRATLAGWGLAGCSRIEVEFGGSNCRSYERFYRNSGRVSPSWTSNGAGLVGNSPGRSTAVESYYVCSYSLPHQVRNVTLEFLGGSVDFSSFEGTGGGLGLLVYAGEPHMDLGTWGNHGNPRFTRWWSKEGPTNQIHAMSQTYQVDLGRSTDRVTVALMLGDAWISQSVRVQVRGLNIKLE